MEEFKYISFRFSDKGRLLKNLSGKIIPLFWVFDTYTSNQHNLQQIPAINISTFNRYIHILKREPVVNCNHTIKKLQNTDMPNCMSNSQ